MDTRVVALVLGVIGAVLGAVALVGDVPVLGLLAGVAALGAGVSAMAGGISAPDADADADELRRQLAARDATLESVRTELDAARDRLEELESAGAHPAAAPSGGHPVVEPARPPVAALTDPESGLFSEAYFRVALDSRLASARRHLRPVAVGLIEVAEGMALDAATPAASARVATALRETVREADIACRLDDGTFAVVLEDTPENGAVWTVERIRRNLVSRFGTHTMWAGIACYPAHAFSTDDLVTQARIALRSAQEWKQDRIEVAVAE